MEKGRMAGSTSAFVPQVDMVGMSLNSYTAEGGAAIDVHFQIENHHPVPVDVVDVDFFFENDDDEEVAVKKVEHHYAIQACSSKLITVPVNFEYKMLATAASNSVVPRVVPCAVRAELNFRQAVSGIFKVSVDKVKHFLSVSKAPAEAGGDVSGYVNGMHISMLSPKQVGFSIILRVFNSNSVQVHLDKAVFTLESAFPDQEPVGLLQKIVNCSQSVPGMSRKRIAIPLMIRFDELNPEDLPKPGMIFPYKMKMDFWFNDPTTHGAYKISQVNAGSFPVLAPAEIHIKEVVFERNADDQPEARMKFHLKMFIPSGMKQATIDYVIKHAADEIESMVAQASLAIDSESDLTRDTPLEAVLEPMQDGVFGSAVWDVFSDKDNTFKAVVNVKGNLPEYGEIDM